VKPQILPVFCQCHQIKEMINTLLRHSELVEETYAYFDGIFERLSDKIPYRFGMR